MNSKRIVIAFCALLVFFGAATWTDLVPTAANWAVLVATCGGFLFGYLFRRDYDSQALIDANNENAALTEEVMGLKADKQVLTNQLAELKEKVEVKPKKAKKVKEETKGE